MKEATGELSTTVIAIVAIAAIMAIFMAFLLPTLRTQIALNQACTSGPDITINNDNGSKITCGKATGSMGSRTWKCDYDPGDGGSVQSKECKD